MSELTLLAAWQAARRRLEAAGVDQPVNDARALLEAAANVDRTAILTDPYRVLSTAQGQRLEALLARREAREPVAYILGRKGFWTLDLEVGPAVLTPRPETEHVVEAALKLAGAQARVLDLGVGSGAILLAILSERPDATGLGVDVSAAALELAQRNAAALGLAGRASFQQGDWAENLPNGAFDIVVSNPPYIETEIIKALAPEISRYEPRIALDGGADGLDAYRAIAAELPRLLAANGGFALEVGAGQAEAVAGLCAAAGLQVRPALPDLAGISRVVWGLAASNG